MIFFKITLVTVKDCQTVQSYVDSLILDLEGLSKVEKVSIIELQSIGYQLIQNKCGLTKVLKITFISYLLNINLFSPDY